ncbi:MAG TPA: hypothetical protein VIU85_05725, partial [Chthoniobacterales bacterium]
MKPGSSTSAGGFRQFLRAEYPLFVGIGIAVAVFVFGNDRLEKLSEPLSLGGAFVILLGAVLWSAMSAVHHADCLAVKCGEPYGTLILTLSVISIEVMMISAAMLHGANNP